MPVTTAIWKISDQPVELSPSSLVSEQMLEEMIVAAPRMLSEEWMLVGRQVKTGFGGILDLLAVAPDGALVLIELKRDKTPREVVAQAIDYASWVETLEADDIASIYQNFSTTGNLANDLKSRFGLGLDIDALNQSHQIIIVAASLDDSTERIISYLSKHDIPINVLCFQVFSFGEEQLLSRSWLIDPTTTQSSAASSPSKKSEPWNGEFYCSFGHDESRSWNDARKYGFISAGGGEWYSRTLNLLESGDRVWVNVPRTGFVGVGEVTGKRQPASSFRVDTSEGEVSVLEVAKEATYHRNLIDDPERCEYFVPVRWLKTVSLNEAVQEVGFFGNQNTICRPVTPSWRFTVEKLKEKLLRRASGST